MKRIEFEEQGFKVVTYNPRGGWVAYIYPEKGNYPLVHIQGLNDKQDALLKIGCEIGYLLLNEVDPSDPYNGSGKWVNYK